MTTITKCDECEAITLERLKDWLSDNTRSTDGWIRGAKNDYCSNACRDKGNARQRLYDARVNLRTAEAQAKTLSVD